MNLRPVWKKHVAITQEHGSWVFIFSPLLIGIFTGGTWRAASGYFILAAVAAFLFKQPLTIAVKVYSKRRSRSDLPAAVFWMVIYGVLILIGAVGLWYEQMLYLAFLVIPALPVLGWYLYLVARRDERKQIGVEVIASGVLALAAPGAYWIGVDEVTPLGWWLWLLCWLQSAASIVYAALRLQQRGWKSLPPLQKRVQAASRALAYTSFNLGFAVVLGMMNITPLVLASAYLVQWGETLYGMIAPAVGVRPTSIGIRQLIVSILYTVLFILLW